MMQDQIAKLEGELMQQPVNDEIIAEGVIDLEVESVIKKKKTVAKENLGASENDTTLPTSKRIEKR